jgi:hypothetical protein
MEASELPKAILTINVDNAGFSKSGFPKWKPQTIAFDHSQASILGTLSLRSQKYQR